MKNILIIFSIFLVLSCNQKESFKNCIGEKGDIRVCLPNGWDRTANDDYFIISKIDTIGNFLGVQKAQGLSNLLFDYVSTTHSSFSFEGFDLIEYSIYEFIVEGNSYLYCIYDYKYLEEDKKFVSVVTVVEDELFEISLSVDLFHYEDYKNIFDRNVLPNVIIRNKSFFSKNILPSEINEIDSDYLDSLISI